VIDVAVILNALRALRITPHGAVPSLAAPLEALNAPKA